MNAGPPPVDSGILEKDVRAIVRLLGRVIAQRLDISVSSVEKHIAKAMLFLSEWTEGW